MEEFMSSTKLIGALYDAIEQLSPEERSHAIRFTLARIEAPKEEVIAEYEKVIKERQEAAELIQHREEKVLQTSSDDPSVKVAKVSGVKSRGAAE
jgi:vacuolar-type H+-ATPase subunit I/STV1